MEKISEKLYEGINNSKINFWKNWFFKITKL